MRKSEGLSPIRRTQDLGVEFWNDSCALAELSEAVAEGAVGATSNPVIVSQALESESEAWLPVLRELIRKERRASEEDLAWGLIEAIAARAARLVRGPLCVQVNPVFYRDPERMAAQARRFAALAPNIAVKIPAVEAGLEAIEALTADGISVNATVSFTVAQALACGEAMERGLRKAKKPVQPYVTLMVGRLDDHLKRVMEQEKVSVDPGALNWAGIAVFKKARGLFARRRLKAKLLAAAYRHHLHWSELVGPGIVQSIPYAWWKRFNGSGLQVEATLDRPVEPALLAVLQDRFPEFRKAYEEDGLSPAGFVRYGASVHTLDQFIQGYHKVLDVVRRQVFLAD